MAVVLRNSVAVVGQLCSLVHRLFSHHVGLEGRHRAGCGQAKREGSWCGTPASRHRYERAVLAYGCDRIGPAARFTSPSLRLLHPGRRVRSRTPPPVLSVGRWGPQWTSSTYLILSSPGALASLLALAGLMRPAMDGPLRPGALDPCSGPIDAGCVVAVGTVHGGFRATGSARASRWPPQSRTARPQGKMQGNPRGPRR